MDGMAQIRRGETSAVRDHNTRGKIIMLGNTDSFRSDDHGIHENQRPRQAYSNEEAGKWQRAVIPALLVAILRPSVPCRCWLPLLRVTIPGR
jgi:hypothetical protein